MKKLRSNYNTLIIGGGITGAGIYRDLSKHNISTLLVDKMDFGSQTSNASSRMLHGGIRYLENMDFKLVREALHEKNLWIQLAPHLAQEKSFCMPIYKESKINLFMLRAGLFLYDMLSGFKNSPHKILNIEETLKRLPGVKKEGLSGSGIYYDAIVDDAKLVLENIYDGSTSPSSLALNYTEAIDIEYLNEEYVVTLKSRQSEKLEKITVSNLVIATGPFTDKFLKKIPLFSSRWTSQLLPSQGIHLELKPDALKLTSPMVIQTKDNRIVFVIAHTNYILVGTTESQPEEDYFNVTPKREEITYLLKNLNDYFPTANLKESDILSAYAGIRPLVKEGNSSNHHKTAREHKIFSPLPNSYIIIGGKLTTFRVMGQKISSKIVQNANIKYNKSLTKEPLQRPSLFLKDDDHNLISRELIQGIIETEFPMTIEDVVKRRLSIDSRAHYRGTHITYEQLLAMIEEEFISVMTNSDQGSQTSEA